MPKKILPLCLAVLTAVTLGLTAQGTEAAAGSCKVASTYFTGEDLYVFLESQEGETLPGEMDLLLNQAQVDTASPESVSGSDTAVAYFFLMDLSTSMIEYQDQIIAFSDSLFAGETQPIQVTVAGFGDRFEILGENLTTDSAVRQAIRTMDYDHTATDVPGGVAKAADYLAGETRPQGEVVNLVVFTDGIPWPEREGSRAEEAAALEETIAGTPEMILHSAVFGNQGNREILSALATGSGVDVTVYGTQDAAKGGRDLANMVDGLAKLTFQPGLDLIDARFEGQVFFNGEGTGSSFLALTNVRNYAVELPADNLSATQPQESFEPEPTASSHPIPSPEPTPSEEPEASAQPSSSPETEQAVASLPGEGLPSAPGQEPDTRTQMVPWIWIVAVIALLAAILLVLWLLLRLRTKGRGRADQTGIAIKLEIISGRRKGSQRIFSLNQPLVMGSGPSCQLVWKDKDMPAQSARIFLQDQTVYIESLSGAEVSVGGFRIYTANRVRSGDEITIANTKFCFRF